MSRIDVMYSYPDRKALQPCRVCGEELTHGGKPCDRCERQMQEDRLERESNR